MIFGGHRFQLVFRSFHAVQFIKHHLLYARRTKFLFCQFAPNLHEGTTSAFWLWGGVISVNRAIITRFFGLVVIFGHKFAISP